MSDPAAYPTPPLRVQPLEYVIPTYRRPGLVTAIGVTSIVVAAAGMLANLIYGLLGLGFMVQAQTRPAIIAAMARAGSSDDRRAAKMLTSNQLSISASTSAAICCLPPGKK